MMKWLQKGAHFIKDEVIVDNFPGNSSVPDSVANETRAYFHVLHLPPSYCAWLIFHYFMHKTIDFLSRSLLIIILLFYLFRYYFVINKMITKF